MIDINVSVYKHAEMIAEIIAGRNFSEYTLNNIVLMCEDLNYFPSINNISADILMYVKLNCESKIAINEIKKYLKYFNEIETLKKLED